MITRRRSLALMSAAAASPCVPAPLAFAAPLAYDLKPVALDDGVWMIPGAQEAITFENGGAIANSVILDTSAGAVLVDTGPSRRYGEALRDLALKLTGKPIARVYLTHFHPDHVFGNQAFDANLIAASDGVIKGMKDFGDGFADSMYRTAGDWMRGTELVLPGVVLKEPVEDFGSRRLRALPMRGHTPSDLALFDERSGMLIAGDLVFLDRAPTTPHADIERWRINLANLGSIPFSRLAPGHGPAEESVRGIEQTRDWLEAIDAQIRDAFEKGLDITEAIALPLPVWTEKIALARYEYERSVMHLYPRLEAERWPRVDKKT